MKSIKNIGILALLLFCASCEEQLNEVPENFITSSNFFNTETEAFAALVGVYQVLGTIYDNNGIIVFGDMAANTAAQFPGGAELGVYDFYQVGAQDPSLLSIWRSSYQGINRANTLIENIVKADMEDSKKEQFIGEAKTLRALHYFNLVRIFGGVPLVVDAVSSLEGLAVPRNSEDEIFAQIIQDLKDAEVVCSDTPESPGRVSKLVATSFLSKVYLTVKDYTNAAESSSRVIQSGNYQLWTNFSDAFTVENEDGKETIFSAQYLAGAVGTNIHSYVSPQSLDPFYQGGRAFGVYIAADELIESFETGETRAEGTIWSEVYVASVDSTVQLRATMFSKYSDEIFDIPNIASGSINFPIIRYSDILLVFAEAENELNPVSTLALESLNKVHRRAFAYSPNDASPVDLISTSQNELRELIWTERFKELALEGHQWFDLKRTDRLVGELGIEDFKQVYPIPQNELDTNPNMEQNPGY